MRIRPLVVSTLALSLIASGFQSQRELDTPYQKWVNEDVAYILTDEERQAWQRLATDEERERFIEQFWLRRDPTPDTAVNESMEEHYRRIAYANERFASGIPGWKTDRGHLYIALGPPDEIESHPSGGAYQRPPSEGGGTTTTYPFELWRYRRIEGLGTDVAIEFVDKTSTGDYRMTLDPSDKNMIGRASNGASSNPFDRLRQFVPPFIIHAPARFRPGLLAQIRADYFPLTESSVRAHITVQLENRDLQFQAKDGAHKAVVNVYGLITTMTGRVTNVFEDTVTVEAPELLLDEIGKRHSIYQKSIPLPPGQYRLNLVLKDVASEKMNHFELALDVPRF